MSTYLDSDGCRIGERWLIHGMNHFWSGGSSDPELANFTDPKGPSGAEVTWSFLSRYTKSSTATPCATASPERGRCRAHWVTVRLHRRAIATRATVDGRRVAIRDARRAVRVRVPGASHRGRSVVVVRARTRGGERFTRRHVVRSCRR